MTTDPNPAAVRGGSSKGEPARARHKLQLEIDDFAWEALGEEAHKMGVSLEELANFALLYYLADRDSGRTARQMPEQAAEAGGRALTQVRTR